MFIPSIKSMIKLWSNVTTEEKNSVIEEITSKTIRCSTNMKMF